MKDHFRIQLPEISLLEDDPAVKGASVSVHCEFVWPAEMGYGELHSPPRIQMLSASCGCARAEIVEENASRFILKMVIFPWSKLYLQKSTIGITATLENGNTISFLQSILCYPVVSVVHSGVSQSTLGVHDAGKIEVDLNELSGKFDFAIPVQVFAKSESRIRSLLDQLVVEPSGIEFSDVRFEFVPDKILSVGTATGRQPSRVQGRILGTGTKDFRDQSSMFEHFRIDLRNADSGNGNKSSTAVICVEFSRRCRYSISPKTLVLTNKSPMAEVVLTSREVPIERVSTSSSIPSISISEVERNSAGIRFRIKSRTPFATRFERGRLDFVIEGSETVSVPFALVGN